PSPYESWVTLSPTANDGTSPTWRLPEPNDGVPASRGAPTGRPVPGRDAAAPLRVVTGPERPAPPLPDQPEPPPERPQADAPPPQPEPEPRSACMLDSRRRQSTRSSGTSSRNRLAGNSFGTPHAVRTAA